MMGMYEGAGRRGARSQRRRVRRRRDRPRRSLTTRSDPVYACVPASLRPRALRPRAPAPLRLCALAPPDYLLINMSVTGILFDFNGVIVDDEPQHCEALIATLAEYGYRARPGHLLSRVPRLRRPRVLPLHLRAGWRGGGGRAALQEAIERKNAHYERAIRGSMQLVPGAAEFIEERRARRLSARHRERRAAARDRAGARPRRAAPALRRDRGRGGRERLQARPAGLQPGAAARSSWRRARCMVIEDSLPGLAAARAAGLRCAMLATSHGERRLRRRRPRLARFHRPRVRPSCPGPMPELDLRLDRARLDRVRHGAVRGRRPPAVFRVDGAGRAHLPAGTAHQRSREARRRQPGLRRAAHAQGDDRRGRLGAPPGRHVHPDRAAERPRRRARAVHPPAAAPARPRDRSHRRGARSPGCWATHGFQVLAKSGVGAPEGAGRTRAGVGRRGAEPGVGGAGPGDRRRSRPGGRAGRRRWSRWSSRLVGRGRARRATRATCTPPGSCRAGPRSASRSTSGPCRRKCATTRSAASRTPRAATRGRRRWRGSTSAGTPTASSAASGGAATSRQPLDGRAVGATGEKEVGQRALRRSTLEDRVLGLGRAAPGGGPGRDGDGRRPAGDSGGAAVRGGRGRWVPEHNGPRAVPGARSCDRQPAAYFFVRCPGPSWSRTTAPCAAVVRHPAHAGVGARQAPSRRCRRPAPRPSSRHSRPARASRPASWSSSS